MKSEIGVDKNMHKQATNITTDNTFSLLELIKIFEEHQDNIIINHNQLQEHYQRTSVKRVNGYRDENGKIITPWLRTEDIDNCKYVGMGSFEFNRNTATINMLVTHKVRLVKVEDKTPILEVAGLLVNELTNFKNYTIVSDGQLNIKSLQVKINSRKTFALLKEKGVLDAEAYDFHREYTIQLDKLPLLPLSRYYGNIDGLFEQLAEIKVISSILSAFLKEESDIFVPEQLLELKKHELSRNTYINFPTTNDYTDLQEALTKGKVDTRLSYKIEIGSKEILNLNKLYPANKFLNRMYRVYERGSKKVFQKPTLKLAFHENIGFRQRLLSSRTKITKVDEFMKPIFDDFLGLENNGIVANILTEVRGDRLVQILQEYRHGKSGSKENLVAAMFAANAKLKEIVDKIYREQVCPLVFYIGSTGVLPNGMDAKAMTAEELAIEYPHLQFSKSEQQGKFFIVGSSIISMYKKTEYYTPGTKSVNCSYSTN
ncbi:hypothetical protein QUB80_31360 [Chlorogloeopsis sp. ULAP01]|uniref:hypothetical protein n=1 Tax=Chlorogloeopsis sp. ULAP01 TaxID=3056483 RepID=UPI0025AA51D2|nr:hypothetical protein [Chlorogloeopsis sp. ULAP01]MDM9385155.1 hypothetical protein [Chlorogloeopsis sp. ULAP01]